MENENKPTNSNLSPEMGTSEVSKGFQVFKEATKLIQEESNRLITWALTILGATILFVSSASNYFHPAGYFKYTYILYFLGWLFLIISIYFGEELTRRFIAGMWQDESKISLISQIKLKINRNFKLQLDFFKYAVLVFSVWIFIFLYWFITIKN